MRVFLLIFGFATGLFGCTPTVQNKTPDFIPGPYGAGVQRIAFKDNQRSRNLAGRIWLPTNAGTSQRQIVYDNIFKGQRVKAGAPLADSPQQFPLVLLSHGSGGGHANLAWLAEMLASYGYIVASVNHPNDTYGDQNPAGIIAKWERPQDLSFLLNQILAHPTFGPRINQSKIGVLGHSSGGYAAAALAGARYDIARLSRYCEGLNYSGDCSIVTEDQVAQTDKSGADLSYRDSRFNLFMAFVPAVGQGFSLESLSVIDSPFLIFGTQDDTIASFDNNAAHYAKGITSARFEVLECGGHFVFFSHCNVLGKQNAAKVCVDAPGIDRAQMHLHLQKVILAFLSEHWSE